MIKIKYIYKNIIVVHVGIKPTYAGLEAAAQSLC